MTRLFLLQYLVQQAIQTVGPELKPISADLWRPLARQGTHYGVRRNACCVLFSSHSLLRLAL